MSELQGAGATPGSVAGTRRQRLGVIGSFVWDVIHGRDVRELPVEEWGGITYALSAADAALPVEWELVPLAKVGADRIVEARRFLRTLPHVASDAAPIEVPQRNNMVELRYHSELESANLKKQEVCLN